MNASSAPGKDGAILGGIVADGNDVIELPTCELINRFRAVARYVDIDLAHYGDRLRANERRGDAGALDIESVAGYTTKKALGHLAAGGVARAEDQDAFFFHLAPPKYRL